MRTEKSCRIVRNLFAICSSDSDFWALVQSLPLASFLFLVQRARFGRRLKTALANTGD